MAYLFLFCEVWSHRLNAVAALDHIGFERNGPGTAVELEEEAAGVAEDCTGLVASP